MLAVAKVGKISAGFGTDQAAFGITDCLPSLGQSQAKSSSQKEVSPGFKVAGTSQE
jgi:hypothetical protein